MILELPPLADIVTHAAISAACEGMRNRVRLRWIRPDAPGVPYYQIEVVDPETGKIQNALGVTDDAELARQGLHGYRTGMAMMILAPLGYPRELVANMCRELTKPGVDEDVLSLMASLPERSPVSLKEVLV